MNQFFANSKTRRGVMRKAALTLNVRDKIILRLKIEAMSRNTVKIRDALSIAYIPGVGRIMHYGSPEP
jgi:malic enzyme